MVQRSRIVMRMKPVRLQVTHEEYATQVNF